MVGTPPAPPHEYKPPLLVYGGVRRDLHDLICLEPSPLAILGTAQIVIDVPLSVVGDTLTLGETIP